MIARHWSLAGRDSEGQAVGQPNNQNEKDGEGAARCPPCSQNAHGERDGTAPVSAFCSRNAHDRNVLVRRPQSGLTRVPFQRRVNEQAWREHLYRSMRAVKGSLGHSPNRCMENRKALVRRAHSRIDQAALWGEIGDLGKIIGSDGCYPLGFYRDTSGLFLDRH